MRKIALTALFASASLGLAFAQYGCGGDDVTAGPTTDASADQTVDTGTDAGKKDTSPPIDTGIDTGVDTGVDTGTDTGSDGGNPPPPTLKTQLDRMGRPAVNTALNHVFDANAATKGPAKDAYNADGTPAGWAAAYSPEFEKNLAIFDGLDTICGNQIGAGASADAGPGRYGLLAGALTDDELYVNTGTATCAVYLGVELKALGVITATDCGGRALPYDVINITYSAVSGAAPGVVIDGTTADATKTGGTTFPYLAPAM